MGKCRLNEIEIAYEVRETRNARGWVALLNGVMASWSSWTHLAMVLNEEGYNVLLHDFRGQLLSEKPPGPYRFEDHVEDLSQLIDHLKISRTHLIGTSYGGEVALNFALSHPGKVEILGIIDSVSQVDPLLRSAVEGWISAAESGDTARFFRIMVPTIYGESFIRENGELLRKREKAMANLPDDYLKGQIELYKTFLSLDISHRLSEITQPALVICGLEDQLKPPRYSKLIADTLANSHYYLLPECGHVAIFEKAEEIAVLVRGFLQKYDKPQKHLENKGGLRKVD